MKKETITIKQKTKVIDALTGFGFTYSQAYKLLKNKDVRLWDEKIKDNFLLDEGDMLSFYYNEELLQSARHKIEIIYQDEFILIVNKPKGMEVEGENSVCSTLIVLAVHRLDRNTTGILILAKNKIAQDSLLAAFKNHTIEKKYLTEVVGQANYSNFRFDAFLIKDAKESRVKIFKTQVKNSVAISTIFNTIKSNPSSSIIECNLLTGKTHQIRASLAFLGHPIIGDGKYGKNEDNKKFKQKSQKLHCHHIKFSTLDSPLEYLNGKSFSCQPDWNKKTAK